MLHFFTTAGRVRRWAYFGRVAVLYVLALAFYSLPAVAEAQFENTAGHWKNIAFVGMLLCAYLVFAQCAKRLHDLNLRSWWLLVLLVPVASLVLSCGMQFVAGTAGPNRFGPDPRHPAPAAAFA